MTLSSPSASLLLPAANATGTVRINDNDDAPVTPSTPSTPTNPTTPGISCGKGTVQRNGKCVEKKKKKKGKKKRQVGSRLCGRPLGRPGARAA